MVSFHPRSIQLAILVSLFPLFSALPLAANESQRPSNPLSVSSVQPRRFVQQSVPKPEKPKEKSVWQVLVDQILERVQRKSVNATTRSGVCAIAPGLLEVENKIFSDRPVFVWQGQVDSLVLKDDLGQVLWRSPIVPGQTSMQYDGPPLIPGEYYTWSLQRQGDLSLERSFQVMNQVERNALKQALSHESEQPSAMVQKQIEYFATQGLWSDAMTVLLAQNVAAVNDLELTPSEASMQLGQFLCLG